MLRVCEPGPVTGCGTPMPMRSPPKLGSGRTTLSANAVVAPTQPTIVAITAAPRNRAFIDILAQLRKLVRVCPVLVEIGPRRGARARWCKPHPSFVYGAAAMGVLDANGRERKVFRLGHACGSRPRSAGSHRCSSRPAPALHRADPPSRPQPDSALTLCVDGTAPVGRPAGPDRCLTKYCQMAVNVAFGCGGARLTA
jgi:hypothetical protein